MINPGDKERRSVEIGFTIIFSKKEDGISLEILDIHGNYLYWGTETSKGDQKEIQLFFLTSGTNRNQCYQIAKLIADLQGTRLKEVSLPENALAAFKLV